MDVKTSKARIEGALNLIPREIVEVAATHASGHGESLEHFVLRSILETIERDKNPSCVMDDWIPEAFVHYLESSRGGGGGDAERRHQTSDNDDL